MAGDKIKLENFIIQLKSFIIGDVKIGWWIQKLNLKGDLFMKRPQIFWTLTILLITCLVFIFSSIQAATSESSFDFDPATGTITSYKGTNPYVEIPDTIGGVKVTTIGVWAFNGC